MRLIGLAVVLTISLLLAPFAAEAQPARLAGALRRADVALRSLGHGGIVLTRSARPGVVRAIRVA